MNRGTEEPFDKLRAGSGSKSRKFEIGSLFATLNYPKGHAIAWLVLNKVGFCRVMLLHDQKNPSLPQGSRLNRERVMLMHDQRSTEERLLRSQEDNESIISNNDNVNKRPK